MTKEQLARWRELGFEFDDFYDTIAVNAKPEVNIKFVSAKKDDKQYIVKVAFTAKNCKTDIATISLNVVPKPLSFLEFAMVKNVTLKGETNTFEFKFDVNPFEPNKFEDVDFVATLTIDGLQVVTNSFQIEKRKDKDEKKDDTISEITNKIITFYTYWNNDKVGKIVKFTPNEIDLGYENKIKYMYIDRIGKEHYVATLEFHEIVEKSNGKKIISLPKESEIISDEKISEGQTERRVIFKNGDIAEFGSNEGKSFWILYKAMKNKLLLVRMPDSLSIFEKELKICFNFKQTKRRYCNPESFSGFIGALAELNRNDVFCTGMCFKEGSSFPSVSHPNGDSVDTSYFATLSEEKLKVTAFKKFHFAQIVSGTKGWFKLLDTDIHKSDHNSHLHAGNFDKSKIIEK